MLSCWCSRNLVRTTHSNLACSLAQNSRHFLMTHSDLDCYLAIARLSLHVRTHSDLACSIARHFGHLGMTQQIKLVLSSCSSYNLMFQLIQIWLLLLLGILVSGMAPDWTCTPVVHYSPHVLTQHSDLGCSLARHSLPLHRNHEIHNWCEILILLDSNSKSWPQPDIVFPHYSLTQSIITK